MNCGLCCIRHKASAARRRQVGAHGICTGVQREGCGAKMLSVSYVVCALAVTLFVQVLAAVVMYLRHNVLGL